MAEGGLALALGLLGEWGVGGPRRGVRAWSLSPSAASHGPGDFGQGPHLTKPGPQLPFGKVGMVWVPYGS